RLMAGEAGYYFTNLMGAAAFIQNLCAEQVRLLKRGRDMMNGSFYFYLFIKVPFFPVLWQLKMDPEKFERLMQGDNSGILQKPARGADLLLRPIHTIVLVT